MVDQILTYVLSAMGILGFLLAGRKVWWAWYVNIANQFIWLAFSVITQQWGFLLATLFYFVVFTMNAVRWTKDHFRTKNAYGFLMETRDSPPKSSVKITVKKDEKIPTHNKKEPERGPVGPPKAVSEGTQQPVGRRIVPEVRSTSDIPKPPGSSDGETNQELMTRFMRMEGTDAAVANEIAFVVSDVMRANRGDDYYVDFAERYSIANEVQRRLDVKLKGTRPDDKKKILTAIHEIDKARQIQLQERNSEGMVTEKSWLAIMHALGVAYGTLESFLKGK